MTPLKNKVVFITGASSGIGAASAKAFATAGANLILSARRIDRLQTFAKELEAEYSIKTYPVAMDVSDNKAVTSVIYALPAEFKSIDVLVNNAGLARGNNKLQDGDIADWEEMINTNIKGLLYVTRAILPSMIKRNYGHIINVGSIAGREPYQGGNVYCATKAAVLMLTKALKLDLHGTNIRSTTIDPGRVETEFNSVRTRGEKTADEIYREITALSAHDVAEAILWSASRPAHVNINEIHMLPVDQSSTYLWNMAPEF